MASSALPLRFSILLLLVLTAGSPATGQPADEPPSAFAQELERLYRLDALPRYRSGSIVRQVSSYDTTGGNNDGFSGLYSFLRREGDQLVVAEFEGPGIIERIWTPTPTDEWVAFYFDGEPTPRLRLPFSDLFSGEVYPFLRPLVGNEVGGYYCYVPLPFARSLKIVYEGEGLRFHQIQYRLLPDAQTLTSYEPDVSDDDRRALERALDAWRRAGAGPPLPPDSSRLLTRTVATNLQPGQTLDLLSLREGGRIVGIEIEPAEAFRRRGTDLLLRARWDDEAQPAIWSPVGDFFGFAFGEPSMQSLVAGTREGVLYTYLPMPFDHAATLQLTYRERPGVLQEPIPVKARVTYASTPRDPAREGKLYAVWRRSVDPPVGEPVLLLDAAGRGHHVGTLLQAQGLDPGMTLFFEGDDVATVDGDVRLHGTGSEDYFNGGWYALLDRWDRGISLPIHGSLAYSLPMARTGGYRFYLADAVPFEETYHLTIEHGPEGNRIPVDYTSVAFYYGDTPPASLPDPTTFPHAPTAPDTHVYFPQLMQVALGWGSAVDFTNRRDLVLSSTGDGLMRLTLDDVPNGTYRLFASYYETPNGGDFSLWQRQRRLSDWTSSYNPDETLVEHRPMGELTLSDAIRTVSIRLRSGDQGGTFALHRVTLERVRE